MKKFFAILGVMLAALVVGCPAEKPAEYAAGLALCTETSKSWDEYEPCCETVARQYGRDPSFCLRDADAGKDAK